MLSFISDIFMAIAGTILVIFILILIDASPCRSASQSNARLRFAGFVILITCICLGISSLATRAKENVLTEIEKTAYSEEIQTQIYYPVSLQDNSEITGNFSKKGSYINAFAGEEDIYTFFYEEDGAYRKGKIVSPNVKIYESNILEMSDTFIPHIIEYTVYHRYAPTEKQIRLISQKKLPQETVETRYEIYVPKGTIISNFTLDAQ